MHNFGGKILSLRVGEVPIGTALMKKRTKAWRYVKWAERGTGGAGTGKTRVTC